MNKVLIIAGCTLKKLDHSAPAKDLYQGLLFKKIKLLAEKHNSDLKILSAKYGIISPDKIIKPYNKTISTKEDIINSRKNVIPKMKQIEVDYERIILIMGKKYREVLEPQFNNLKYKMLYDLKGIGNMLSRINKFINSPIQNFYDELIFCNQI